MVSHPGEVSSGNILEVNLSTGEIFNHATGQKIEGSEPYSRVQMEIYQAGNLFEYGRTILP